MDLEWIDIDDDGFIGDDWTLMLRRVRRER